MGLISHGYCYSSKKISRGFKIGMLIPGYCYNSKKIIEEAIRLGLIRP